MSDELIITLNLVGSGVLTAFMLHAVKNEWVPTAVFHGAVIGLLISQVLRKAISLVGAAP